MNFDNKWYTPIIYILFVAGTAWLIGNVTMNTTNDIKVTDRIKIREHFEDLKPTEMQIFDTLNDDNFEEVVFDSLPSETELPIDIKQTVNQSDSSFFESLMAGAKTYDSPVKKAIIRYYKKDMDQDKVKILQQYGFYIHERPSELQKTHSSNALYIGDSINNRDILIVAYSLLEQGIELKYITESRGHDGWKSNAIEVVTDTTVINDEILSLQYLIDNWGDL